MSTGTSWSNHPFDAHDPGAEIWVQMTEWPASVVCTIRVPDCRADAMDAKVEGHDLVLRVGAVDAPRTAGAQWEIESRTERQVFRRIPLPQDADVGRVVVSRKNGTIVARIPRKKLALWRFVKLSFGML